MNPTVLTTRSSTWGEGPVWWQDHLYYVDIEGHALLRFNPETGEEKNWPIGQRIGFALPCSSGRWIGGGDDGLFFLNLENGETTPILDPEPHLPDNRFNDAAVSPDGRLFAGTIAMKKAEGTASLYRVDSDLTCTSVFPNVTNSNGLGWTADGKTCFYIDTPSFKVRKFDYDSSSGDLSNEQIAFTTEQVISASPDGLCVDINGHVWIAFCHGGCVIKFDPESGEVLERFNFPAMETTSCCFGGENLTDLYVTTGISSKKSEEHAGKVFVIRNAGQGLAQPAFRDS